MIKLRSLSTVVLTAAMVSGLGAAVVAPSASAASEDSCTKWTDGTTVGYRCTALAHGANRFNTVAKCSGSSTWHNGDVVDLGQTSYVWCSKYGGKVVSSYYTYLANAGS